MKTNALKVAALIVFSTLLYSCDVSRLAQQNTDDDVYNTKAERIVYTPPKRDTTRTNYITTEPYYEAEEIVYTTRFNRFNEPVRRRYNNFYYDNNLYSSFYSDFDFGVGLSFDIYNPYRFIQPLYYYDNFWSYRPNYWNPYFNNSFWSYRNNYWGPYSYYDNYWGGGFYGNNYWGGGFYGNNFWGGGFYGNNYWGGGFYGNNYWGRGFNNYYRNPNYGARPSRGSENTLYNSNQNNGYYNGGRGSRSENYNPNNQDVGRPSRTGYVPEREAIPNNRRSDDNTRSNNYERPSREGNAPTRDSRPSYTPSNSGGSSGGARSSGGGGGGRPSRGG
ncbi:MAG: hypothetical protein K2Q03_07185 [Sphingobacteriaceae bacterium]|nr:hypothetical protein [Sphingobacteriaceae bacterium]